MHWPRVAESARGKEKRSGEAAWVGAQNARSHTLDNFANGDDRYPSLTQPFATHSLATSPLPNALTVSLSPCLLKNGNNLVEALKSLGFLHLSWASNTAPIFYELRRSLIDSRACSKPSSDFFNGRIMSYSGGASAWTRLTGLAKVLSNDVVEMQ